jgi:hypothetical protein
MTEFVSSFMDASSIYGNVATGRILQASSVHATTIVPEDVSQVKHPGCKKVRSMIW